MSHLTPPPYREMAVEAADVTNPATEQKQASKPSEIHGIVFGMMGKPTHVLVPGYDDPKPENFAAWLDKLRAEGWQVTLTPALSFEGVLVDARH